MANKLVKFGIGTDASGLQTSAEPAAPAIIAERSEIEHARLAELPEERVPWGDSYEEELGIGKPQSDADKREADLIAALPHETRASSETADNLAEMKELNCAAVAGQRWPNQAELGREPERLGRILHAHEFIQTLWKCGIVCVLTRCDTRGLRSLKGEHVAQERRAQYARTMAGLVINSSRALPLPAPRYVTWVQIPYMVEYSVMRFDEHQVPTSEKYRGWRTVLIELIRQGFLTEADANGHFGPATGPAALRWQQIMQQLRMANGVC